MVKYILPVDGHGDNAPIHGDRAAISGDDATVYGGRRLGLGRGHSGRWKRDCLSWYRTPPIVPCSRQGMSDADIMKLCNTVCCSELSICRWICGTEVGWAAAMACFVMRRRLRHWICGADVGCPDVRF